MKYWIFSLLLVIFGGVVLHAPLSVWLGTILPDAELIIKSWKEVLLFVTALLVLFEIFRRRSGEVLRDPLFLIIGLYGLLHLALLPLMWRGWLPTMAGLLIDLRYLIFFVLVFAALKMYPDWRSWFVRVGVAGALVVTVFGVLQVTVLPHDALAAIGYDKTTISPYLTVDDNPAFVRINSTMRGPNPLGAYMAIILAGVAAYLLRGGLRTKKREVVLATLAAFGVVCLWFSYSRSAWLAAIVALAVVSVAAWPVVVSHIRRRLKAMIIVWSVLVVGLIGILLSSWGHNLVSNVIFHENEGTGPNISSNEGHVNSLVESTDLLLKQPLGGGVGSTGSASLLGDKPFIIENQFLFIAHESGWLGLVLFVAMLAIVLIRLWQARHDWLSLAVFASGVGMVIIGILLPVFVDDTVAYIWWGLAAVALATSNDIIKAKYGR